MGWRRFVLAAACALAAAGTRADTPVTAAYASPVERYGHFALGRPHEYADLVATLSSGQQLRLTLPDDEVFEDAAPRPVRLSPDGPTEWLAIVSQRDRGARLALIGVVDGRLAITAESPPIGTPQRWLNPVGVADLDGDGRAEIAAVVTPHIGGTLKVYRRDGPLLIETAALPGFSNHVYGSPELALSMPLATPRASYLIVPDARRSALRAITLVDGQLSQRAHWRLPAPIVGPLRRDATGALQVPLAFGTVHSVSIEGL